MATFFLCEAYLPVALLQMRSLEHLPFLKMSWRTQMTACLLTLVACVEANVTGNVTGTSANGTQQSHWMASPRATISLLGVVSAVGVSWAGAFALFTCSLSMTSVAHATIGSIGTPPFFLILHTVLIKCQRPMLVEVVGVVLATCGITIAMQDAGSRSVTIQGDALALGSGVLSAWYGLCIRRALSTTPAIPTFKLQAAYTVAALPIALALPVLSGEASLHDGSPRGLKLLFGWVYGTHLPQMLFLAIGMGIICQVSIMYIVQEVGPLAYALVLGVCPAGSAVMGYVCGDAPIPGVATVMATRIKPLTLTLCTFAPQHMLYLATPYYTCPLSSRMHSILGNNYLSWYTHGVIVLCVRMLRHALNCDAHVAIVTAPVTPFCAMKSLSQTVGGSMVLLSLATVLIGRDAREKSTASSSRSLQHAPAHLGSSLEPTAANPTYTSDVGPAPLQRNKLLWTSTYCLGIPRGRAASVALVADSIALDTAEIHPLL